MAPVYGGVVTIAVTVTPVPHDIYDFEWRWWQAPAVKTKLWTTEKEYGEFKISKSTYSVTFPSTATSKDADRAILRSIYFVRNEKK
jgi:hypothetical protein